MANNWVGWQVALWLREAGEHIAALAIHPPPKRRYGDEIISALDLPASRVFDASRLREPAILEAIEALGADLALSISLDYVLRPELISLFPGGVLNLHAAYLPYNRGQYPNVWSIVEGTPAGVTLHYVDAGIDTGDIVAQREVAVEPADTGETLFRKLEQASVELFRESWGEVRSGKAARRPQPRGAGTYHRTRDVERIDRIDLDRAYAARELIDVLRARTFPPHPGAYFIENGRKLYLRLQILEEEQL
jgi:methionyl-tRNA formyltransferase